MDVKYSTGRSTVSYLQPPPQNQTEILQVEELKLSQLIASLTDENLKDYKTFPESLNFSQI